MKEKKDENTAAGAAFSSEQILASKRWSRYRDALSAALTEDKRYTAAEVEQVLDAFMKGKVN